jgi:integration host factor subunit alpha
MTQKVLTRNEIHEKISQEINVTKQKAGIILGCVLNEMIESLAREGGLKLSTFGNFLVRQKNERIARNPKTGVAVTITPRKTVYFKASNTLKGKVSNMPSAKVL